jgi:hypothetical protein
MRALHFRLNLVAALVLTTSLAAVGCSTDSPRSNQQSTGDSSHSGSGSDNANSDHFSYHDAFFAPGCGPNDRYAFFIGLSSAHDAGCVPHFADPTVWMAITPDTSNITLPATYMIQGDGQGSFGNYCANGAQSCQFAVSGTLNLTGYQQSVGSEGSYSFQFADGSTLNGEFTTGWCQNDVPAPCGG